ncbi:MAG: hypothetical protein IT436_13845 [Phycisphaerales bacterium]|nr:hypothetical protein [Phycisphaerales bacterium]
MNPDAIHIPALDQALAALDGSPVGLYLIPAIALIAGAFLWAAGGRALKPLFILIAAITGASLGLNHLTPLLAPHIRSFPPHYAGLGFGALAGLLLAIAFFRALMGLAAAITLSAIAFTIAAAAMGLRTSDLSPPATSPDGSSTASTAALYERAVIVYGRQAPALAQPEPRPDRRANEPALSTAPTTSPPTALDTLRARAQSAWSALPGHARYNLSAAALAGAVLGLVIGILAPRKSAALVTASLGAGLMLFATASLIHTLEPGHSAQKVLAILNQRGPAAWLITWSALAFLGLAIQSHKKRTPAPSAASR